MLQHFKNYVSTCAKSAKEFFFLVFLSHVTLSGYYAKEVDFLIWERIVSHSLGLDIWHSQIPNFHFHSRNVKI